jgi:hypothetical protein
LAALGVTLRIRTGVAVGTTLAIGVTLGIVAAHQLGKRLSLRLPGTRPCVVDSGGAGGAEILLDADQMANAATVSAVGISRHVPQRAIMIALATAWQESKLHNLDAGDRDSIGLFQQRPSQGWGTPDEIADPRYAAQRFYGALLKVEGWETMRVTDAAQAVQRSAHPEAYEKWTDKAEGLSRALIGDTTGAVACTIDTEPAQRGPAAADALAAGLRLDWGGQTRPENTGDMPGLTLPVADGKVGWQYAHWLVAYAEQRGVKRVRFTDREWTAKGGSWTKVTAAPEDSGRVVAEVYGDA